jgi:hypothetical protein
MLSMMNSLNREKHLLPIIGVIGVAFVTWGHFHASANPNDWKGLVYTGPRVVMLSLGLLAILLRHLPSSKFQFAINNSILSLHSHLWNAGGLRGVIVLAMIGTYVLSTLLNESHAAISPGSWSQLLLTRGFDFTLVAWFAGTTSFFLRGMIRLQRLDQDGARQTLPLWRHFFDGVGVCRLILIDHNGYFGPSTAAVRALIERRIEVLRLATGFSASDVQDVRELSCQVITSECEPHSVRSCLELRYPTIVIGGPRSNPVCCAYLEELERVYFTDDGAGMPIWKVEPKPSDTRAFPSFVMATDRRTDHGIHIEAKGFSLHKGADASCGVAYFQWRDANPLCVIAGFDQKATIEISRYVLNSPIGDLSSWIDLRPNGLVVELLFRVEADLVTVEDVRRYTASAARSGATTSITRGSFG